VVMVFGGGRAHARRHCRAFYRATSGVWGLHTFASKERGMDRGRTVVGACAVTGRRCARGMARARGDATCGGVTGSKARSGCVR
jgi:hypothetical protein